MKHSEISILNPHTPVAQKVADEVVFDVSKVKESSFFNRTSLSPFWEIPILVLPAFIFQWIFFIKIIF